MCNQLLQAFVEGRNDYRPCNLEPFGPNRLEAYRFIQRYVDKRQVARRPNGSVKKIFGAQRSRFVTGNRRASRTSGVAGDDR